MKRLLLNRKESKKVQKKKINGCFRKNKKI